MVVLKRHPSPNYFLKKYRAMCFYGINPVISSFRLWVGEKKKFGFSLAMDIRNWCNSGCKTVCLGRGYYEIEPVNSSPSTTGSNKPKWKVLWMKFKKERRKIFESDPAQGPYDPYSYSKNFDEGFAWDEPDSLSRSFSMRFADPSMVFIRKAAV